jgi:hypothetical protein
MTSRKALSDGRTLMCVFLASTIATAFAADYLLREWLLFAMFGAALFVGSFIPRSISILSAVWGGTICGVGLALLIALYRAVYG